MESGAAIVLAEGCQRRCEGFAAVVRRGEKARVGIREFGGIAHFLETPGIAAFALGGVRDEVCDERGFAVGDEALRFLQRGLAICRVGPAEGEREAIAFGKPDDLEFAPDVPRRDIAGTRDAAERGDEQAVGETLDVCSGAAHSTRAGGKAPSCRTRRELGGRREVCAPRCAA